VGKENYAEIFGFQWKTFRTAQIDSVRYSGSLETFRKKTGFSEEFVKGKRILDVGVGAGRYADLVSRWGEGNWSGSAGENLRTLRAGAALQEVQGKRFLVYAVFTSATPSAMARVLQAYRCSYAMLLDMNALEHTYLALYRREGPNFWYSI
jgi:hypothetical protein